MSSLKNNLISFTEHIINDVVNKMDGKYTYDQVKNVFFASISYLVNLSKYTDNVSISVHGIGTIYNNIHGMEKRLNNLNRLKRKGFELYDNQKVEYECLQSKIKAIKESKGKGEMICSDMRTKDVVYSRWYKRRGKTYSEIQDIQDVQYKM